MAGEYNVTMPVVFENDLWQHTMTAKRLVIEDGKLRRVNFLTERLNGIIYLARTEDVNVEIHNLAIIKQSGLPCWPPVDQLIRMTNRHVVMDECAVNGLTTDPVWTDPVWTMHNNVWTDEDGVYLEPPYVVKIGQSHQGQDKYLIQSREELSVFLKTHMVSEMTVEKFYTGLSVRVLFIGDDHFGVQYHNEQSWIKNSAGCEYDDWKAPKELVDHADKVRKHFGLEVAGIDYVIEENGTFHFLEINQFPGLKVNDATVDAGRSFLRMKMKEVENNTIY